MKQQKSSTRNQYIATLIATGTGISIGMSFVWTSPIESQIVMDDNGDCPEDICVTKPEFAWIASCMAVGALVFGFLAGPLMTKIGRKPAILVYFVPSVFSWVFVTFAKNIWMLYIGRLCAGAAWGGAFVIIPIYLGEIAQSSIRGRLSAIFQVMLCSGNLITYTCGYLFSMYTQNCVSLVVALLSGIGLTYLPESPRYYVFNNEIEKGKRTLKTLRGENFDPEKEIQDMIEFQKSHDTPVGLHAFFEDKANFKSLVIILGLMTGFRMSGINGVLFYTATILKDANIGIEPDLAVIFIGMVSLSSTFCSSFTVDFLGRRTLLLFATAVLFICFVLMGTYFMLQSSHPDLVENFKILPVILLCIYICANTLGFASALFVIMGEIFPQNVKGLAAGISMVWNNFLLIVVAIMFPYFTEMFGSGVTFFTFSTFIALTFVFIYFVVPETKGKTLEEIQILLSKSS